MAPFYKIADIVWEVCLSFFNIVQVSRCSSVLMSQCPIFLVFQCPGFQCLSVLFFWCPGVPMFQCPGVLVFQCPSHLGGTKKHTRGGRVLGWVKQNFGAYTYRKMNIYRCGVHLTRASRTTRPKGSNSCARNNRLQITDDHMQRIRLQVSANNK